MKTSYDQLIKETVCSIELYRQCYDNIATHQRIDNSCHRVAPGAFEQGRRSSGPAAICDVDVPHRTPFA